MLWAGSAVLDSQIHMYYVYVLYSKEIGKFYIGYTDDLKRRMSDHRSGKVHTTYRMKDFELAYL